MAMRQKTFIELSKRSHEMMTCTIVDANRSITYERYVRVANLCHDESFLRMMDYLQRNKLWNNFIAEDNSGKR